MAWINNKFWLTGPDTSVPPEMGEHLESARKHMRDMFGDTSLPAIIYKGEPIPARTL